ncbi:methyltransferase domain-containing protein [Aquimarina addita]|uniref:Methyltransferase domain-containing protein n=1 Tax=Aquimarina addita TaxID=870485 RepID=A0ABP7X963_9FLAO
MNKDIFGLAITDFYHHKYCEDIIVQAPDFDDDVIPVSYLFRSYDDMPAIEQKALDLAYGKILDIGCGAGSHSLFLQEKQKLDVHAIDISKGAIEICKKRGLAKASTINIFDVKGMKYDTLLLLMNGSGIIGKLSHIDHFFIHIKSILKDSGQILIDSSDISYLFVEEDGGLWVDASAGYYGEMQYKLTYKNNKSDWFDWLYLDFNTLQNAANAHGFLCELIIEGSANDFLARLTLV